MGFAARDTLVTVVNTMWGAFWLAIGLLYFLVVRTCVRCFGEWGGGMACSAVPCSVRAHGN